MKKVLGSAAAKAVAVLLILALGCVLVLSSGAVVVLAQDGLYDPDSTFSFPRTAFADQLVQEQNRYAGDYYWYGTVLSGLEPEPVQYIEDAAYMGRKIDPARTSYRYRILDESGNVVATSIRDGEALDGNIVRWISGYFENNINVHYTVEGCVVSDRTQYDDAYSRAERVATLLYAWRNSLIALVAVTFLACVGLLVFLLAAAGRRRGSETAELSWFDRIPADLMLAGVGTVEILIAYGIAQFIQYGLNLQRFLLLLLFGGLLTAAGVLLLLLALMSVAVRLKTRTFLKNTLIFRVLRLCWRILCWMGRGVRAFFRNLPLLFKWVAGFIAFGLIELLLVFSMGSSGFATFLFLGFNLAVFVLVCMAALQMNRLKKAGEALANGQMEVRVDTQKMFWEFKRHGENLNAIGDGISRAVTARLKSERMKTDLITNVSHDLKTPLTSIVNYVDLLQKEEIGNETAKGYVEVLDRQAQRLKKLTTDLVEASKASSGVINAELLPVNATELVSQSIAEYAERFAAAEVTPVLTAPERAPHILADGRLLWRVFDNLLGNVVKYSLPGTRVYCTVEENDKSATVSIKNISREPLNVSADELMERFVRGDASRAAEGSGLGLSIARSLVELMQGRFEIVVDGDLFTAKVTFLKPAG